MVDAAFWASLRREEGYSPTISLAYLPPGGPSVRLTLERSLALAPVPLTRLGPAVERPGIHLGVWRENGELRVWGSTRSLPPLCLVVEVITPGLLVIKHSRSEESGKFANIAVLEGDTLKMLDTQAAAQSGKPLLLEALRNLDSDSGTVTGSGSVLIQMAISMRGHHHGGTLLIVPSGSDAWRQSIVQPIRYAVAPGFTRLAELVREDFRGEQTWQEAVRSAVDGIAGLTAVDGAAVMTDEYELVAFGATIGNRNGGGEIERLALIEPVRGSTPVLMRAAQFGGTRHLSAAQFVHDQHDAVALVASKDGRFTVFAWSEAEQIVQAHRIETLLM